MTQPSSLPGTCVRAFAPRDWPSVEAICRNSPEAAQWAADSFLNPNAALDRTWVAEREGRVRGFLTVRRLLDEAEILNLAIAPDSRRAGLATLLLETAFADLRASNTKTVHLEVRESNAAAISFYQRHGFTRSSVRPAYYRDPVEAALCLVKDLRA